MDIEDILDPPFAAFIRFAGRPGKDGSTGSP